jgi:hypothetical protein
MAEEPEELQLEKAVARVSLKSDAASPPVVTRDEVRCLLEALRFPESTEYYIPPRALTSPSLWDEEQARVEVVSLKCTRALTLSSESSAGQSSQMNQVYEHLLTELARLQPYEAA